MKVLLRSNDPVLLSFSLNLLREEGIMAHVLDENASIVEGSIGAIPRRLVVTDGDRSLAERLLENAGIELSEDA